MTVQLSESGQLRAPVAGLAAEHGTDLEAYLLQRVETDVAMEMHAAVKMNRLADSAPPHTVQQVLAEQLAAQILRRRHAGASRVRGDRRSAGRRTVATSVPIATDQRLRKRTVPASIRR